MVPEMMVWVADGPFGFEDGFGDLRQPIGAIHDGNSITLYRTQ